MMKSNIDIEVERIRMQIPKLRRMLGFKQPLVHGIPGMTCDHESGTGNEPTHQCPDCGAYWRYIPAGTFPGEEASWSVRSWQWGDCCERGDMKNMIDLNRPLRIK